MMKKIIVFDLGGVLVVDGVYPMQSHLAKKFSLNYSKVKKFTINGFKQMFEGRYSELSFWKKFDKEFDVKTNPKILEKRLNNYYKINAQTKNLIKKLRRNGYKIGFLSNSVREIVRYLEKKYKISKLFDFGIYSHNVKTRKPKAKIFKLLLKKIGAKPDEIIFIDDNSSYLKGARKLGIKTVRYVSTKQLADDLKKSGVQL